jgi:hypothetical protein
MFIFQKEEVCGQKSSNLKRSMRNKSCNGAPGESLGFQESDGEIVQKSDTL